MSSQRAFPTAVALATRRDCDEATAQGHVARQPPATATLTIAYSMPTTGDMATNDLVANTSNDT
ncbi:MAG: hypothetical protein HQK58_12325 [Deltaproteobacteria bacterium]|nr:hypothetical protein [Deltaproteobacteria bacterium]